MLYKRLNSDTDLFWTMYTIILILNLHATNIFKSMPSWTYIYIAQWSFASITTFSIHSVSLHLSTCCVTGFDVVVQARVLNWGPLFEIWVYMAYVRIWRVDTYLCTCIIDNNSVWNMIFLYETDFTFRSWENVISYENDLGINPENRLLDILVV